MQLHISTYAVCVPASRSHSSCVLAFWRPRARHALPCLHGGSRARTRSPLASSATRPGPWPWVERKTAVGSCVALRRVRKAGEFEFIFISVQRTQGGHVLG